MTNAYTYLIVRKADRKRYIGFRSANRLDPKDDLGVEYFTTSDVVRPEFERNPSAFMFRVLQEFDCAHEARTVEFELIRDIGAVKSPQYLNRGNYGVGSIEIDGTPRPVVGVSESGDIEGFPSVAAAKRAYGGAISNALLGVSKTAYGMVWQYEDQRSPISPQAFANDKKRAVLAWEGGEIAGFYESASEAARELGNGRPFGIVDAAAGRVKSSLGFQWTYADRPDDHRICSQSIEALPIEDATCEIDEGPEEWLIGKEAREIEATLHKSMLDSMTDKQREAFTLVRIQGLTWADACHLLRISNGSIAERLAGADKKIKDALVAADK